MTSTNQEDSFKQHVNSSVNIFTVMFIIFILIKTVYFYTSSEKIRSINQISLVFTLAFATIFFLFSYFTNVSITENKLICGEKNYKIAFYATIIPFILIYSVGVALINVLEGWVRCFSNTFGSSILSFSGLTEEISKEIRNSGNSSMALNSDEMSMFLSEAYVDESGDLQFTDNRVIQFNSIVEEKIKKYVYCKNSIGDGIWHYLLGIITLLVSYNAILAENCNAFTVKKDEFRKYLNDKFEKN